MYCTSRPEIPPARRLTLRPCWLVLLCAWLLAGCIGGSGSSGFDLQLREDRAIDAALDTNGCEINEGLTICAAGGAPSPAATATVTVALTATPTPPTIPGTATPSPPIDTTATPTPVASPTTTQRAATASPTPTRTELPAAPQIDTNVTPGDAAPCVISQAGGPCLFEFSFAPLGFDDGVTYRVGVRAVDAAGSGDWSILPPPIDNGASFTVVIALDPAAQYQTAVLVFTQPPGTLPDQVQRLAETKADYAFVSPSFGVVATAF